MRHAYAQMSPARRQQILDDCYLAGKLGAARVPDTVLFADGRDPSDSMIIALVESFEQGKSEKETV